jgi:phosphoribosylglycinamide formyltransferase-1
MNIAVFASGNGTNFLAIANAVKRGYIKADLSLLVCDQPKAGVIAKAAKLKINTAIFDRQDFTSKLEFENAILDILKKEKIDLIVLAGYMRILGPRFVRCFKNKIINIHPAILPAFKGVESIAKAFEYGCKVTGVTVHFVDEEMDHGPIILQETVTIINKMTLAQLEKKIHALEHKFYPLAIRLFCQKKLRIVKRRVMVLP